MPCSHFLEGIMHMLIMQGKCNLVIRYTGIHLGWVAAERQSFGYCSSLLKLLTPWFPFTKARGRMLVWKFLDTNGTLSHETFISKFDNKLISSYFFKSWVILIWVQNASTKQMLLTWASHSSILWMRGIWSRCRVGTRCEWCFIAIACHIVQENESISLAKIRTAEVLNPWVGKKSEY